MQVSFRLDVFEGPLDLLLHLISRNKVSIEDIPIGLILDQYLEELSRLDDLNVEYTADFVAMAAQLVLIKSRMLLPRHEEQLDDPRDELARALLEYQQIKAISGFFFQQGDLGAVFTKPPEPLEPDTEYTYNHPPDELLSALRDLLGRNRERAPVEPSVLLETIHRREASIDEAVVWLTNRLSAGRQPLSRIFAEASGRSGAVAVFLALLEMCRDNRIFLDEEDNIWILP